jgi:phosphorylcholine metabolism protein LicD
MKMETLDQIQKENLVLLLEFDRICKTLNIRYFLIAGTLLGCIRDGGFIAWDDDVDVAMPRRDYDLFIKKSSSLLGQRYFFDCFENNKNYPFNFGKLKDRNVPFCEPFLKNTKNSHFFGIDVFPLDYSSKCFYKMQNHLAYFWEECRWNKQGVEFEKKHKILLCLFSWLPIRILNFFCRHAQKSFFHNPKIVSWIGMPGKIDFYKFLFAHEGRI